MCVCVCMCVGVWVGALVVYAWVVGGWAGGKFVAGSNHALEQVLKQVLNQTFN